MFLVLALNREKIALNILFSFFLMDFDEIVEKVVNSVE